MAMIYAQSRSERQTIISLPLELEYNGNSGELLDESTIQQYHQLDGSVICNYSSEPSITTDGKMYNLSVTDMNTVVDSPEDLLCAVPIGLPDMPAVSTGYNESIAIGSRPVVLDENPEQSMDDDTQNSETEIGLKGLKWQAFLVDSWFTMCDSQLLEINYDEVANGLSVEADKGFNFSSWDESFVCQKKNHFQISVQLKLNRLPKYIKTEHHEIENIQSFSLHLYGVKFESPGTLIQIEQSKTDRTKLPYEPIVLDFPTIPDQVVKATACRLHFSETTANNMRKRGKPNPDQKYFALVVAVHAYTLTCDYPVVAYVSERIIVRASNPGQFDNEGDSIWLKSNIGDSAAYYNGKIGINTEIPEEALTVVGNVSVTGSILHPSDKRLKENFKKIHTKDMLDNVQRMTLYSYSFKNDAFHGNKNGKEKQEVGLNSQEVGLIAQEVQMIIPDAIHEMDFQGTSDVRMINKDRILMELLGAVQELCREREERKSETMSTTLLLIISFIIILILSFFL